MASASAARVARFRQRQRDEEILLKISVPENALIEAAIEADMLPEHSDHGPEALARVVERLVRLFVRERM
jgi:hypothetical protein